jgi:DNA-binding XRE family transcriptional regulator
MKTHRWADIRKRSKLTAEQREESTRWAQREALELSLREVREMAGKTQVDLAKEAEIAQGELSRIERRDDHLLSTLRKYIEALGGDLEVVAVFNDKRVRLRGV